MNIAHPFYINSDDVVYLLGILRDGLNRPSGQDPTIGAIRRLADLRERVAVPLFNQALNHPNVTVRVDAALALHTLNEEAGLKALIFFASEDKSAVSAIRALAKTNDPNARDALLQLKASSGGKICMFNGDMMPLGRIIDEILGIKAANGTRLYIYKNNQQHGPYDESAVLEWIRTGQCLPRDLAIREGMADWQPLGMIFPMPVTTSGNIEMEMDLFDTRAEELEDLFSRLRGTNFFSSKHLVRQYEQKLQVMERQVYSLKNQFPDSDEVKFMESFFYTRCSGLKMEQNNWTEALSYLNRAVSMLDTPNFRIVRASVYLKLNQKENAFQDLNHILTNPLEDEGLYSAARRMMDEL